MEMSEENNELYERTSEDVESMISHAKLDGRNLTEITQAIYFPIYSVKNQGLKLLELNPHLLEKIEGGQTLYFKGGLSEKVVLCTDNKTFELKEAEISNSLLLVSDLKLAQATHSSPIKSPKEGINRSLDRSLEDDANENSDSAQKRQLERREVFKIFHEYYECREIKPRYRKLNDLLQLTRYSGSENEYCIEKKLLFTYKQLLDTIQCSQVEFAEGLRSLRAIEVDGFYRILDCEYEYRVISLMLALINENSWQLDEIERDTTIESLNGIIPAEIVNGIFEVYTIPSKRFPMKFQYLEKLICRIIAQYVLQQGLKFGIDDFLSTWQDALPEGMMAKEEYLKGIGIIDRESSVPCIRALNELNLPTNLLERLIILFKTKEKWTLDQIQPYIECFTTPQLQATAILTKHARSLTIQGERWYVSKHGKD